MTIIEPEGIPTLATSRIQIALAVADPASVSLATEINAASSFDFTGLVHPAGWSPTGNTNKGTAQARLSSKTQKERFNRTTWTFGDFQYAYDPQGEPTDPINEAYAALTEGLAVYGIERLGLDADDAFALAQKIRTHHVRLGPQIPSGDRTDENGEYFITQSVIYIDDPVDGVIVA